MQRRPVVTMLGTIPILPLLQHAQLAAAAHTERVSLVHDLPRTTEALFDLTHGAMVYPTDQIELMTAPLVEYAPRWPVRIVNRISSAKWIALVVEQNPQPLAAVFHFEKGALPEIGMNLKIADSSQLTVIVAAAGRFYGQRRFVRLVGNCG